jgi:hypothetical protein
MATLTGKYRDSSYGGILIISDDSSGATASLQTIYTANGVATPLQLSTTTLNVNGTFQVNGLTYPIPSAIAPSDATYICQTSNSTLTAEQALSSLITGYVKVTTGTGVLSSVSPTEIDGLVAISGTGMVSRTASGTYTPRTIAASGAGLAVTNGDGVSGAPTVALADDAAALEALSTTGAAVRTGTSTWATRTLTAPAAGITVTNGDGVSGNPTLVLANDLAGVEGLSTNGMVARTATDTWTTRSVTGTTNQIDVANGDGVAGAPTVSISATYVGQASITTLGTVTTGTWSATTVAVNKGGTGQTSYTDGQLLIGNTTGNTLAKGTLTAPAAGISITGGAGSITFALTNDLSAVEGLSSNGIATRTATDTWTTRTITGTSNKIDVTNGDGVAGAPTLTISSTLDLSGNTSVAIPSGAGGTTINAAGKVCVDTTSKTVNFYDGAAEKVLQPEIKLGSISVPSPGAAENWGICMVNWACTVTKIHAVLRGSSTPSVTYKVIKGSDRSAAGTAVVTAGSTVTSTTTGTSVTSFDSASITAGDNLWFTTTAQSGTVSEITVTVYGTITP